MKLRRFAIVALSLGLLIATSNTLSGTISRQKFSESYPSVVCPATLSGLSSQVSPHRFVQVQVNDIEAHITRAS